jgi:enterochelin esterase-like enzyme
VPQSQVELPALADGVVAFALPDEGYRAVALRHELRRPRAVPFHREGDGWSLRLERPPVDRLEYLLELEHADGGVETVPDPGNPLRAPGAFGDRSVLELPEYEPPAWVDDDESPAGTLRELTLESRLLRTSVDAVLWRPVDTDDTASLPLVLVHDGPEYARFSQLLRLFDHLVAFGEVPSFRAALLPPPLDRNETYSASTRYARALADEWLPAIRDAAPSDSPPVGLGASLGALSLLHAQWTAGTLFAALLLQSGSYFRRRWDAHERAFPRYPRVTRFVSRLAGGREAPERIPVRLTCGTGEENLDNNRFVAETLAAHGWDARLHEHRDAHNWISWRDSLQPHLAELILLAAG